MAMAQARAKEAEEARERRERVRVAYEQWTELNEGQGYTASGRTVGNLPPGFYDLTAVEGRVIWIPVRSRLDKIIRFPDSRSEEVVVEIERFWEREEAFKRYGLPYKRGILLWGPPGSGKSCTLHLISEDVVKRGGVVVMFPTSSLFLDAYRQLRDIQPDVPVVVLMEDLDSLIEHQNESKILNLLDGVEDLSKTIFVATTNYPGKLGARIINRPSRFDRRLKIGPPSAASRRIYINTLLVEGDEGIDVDKLVRDTENFPLSHIKELFIATHILEADYDRTLRILKKMLEGDSTTPIERMAGEVLDLDEDDPITERIGRYA